MYAVPNGDDSFAWQYKTDSSNWISFYTAVARVDEINQAYSVSLGTPSNTLYIRAVSFEGVQTTGDSDFFILRSAAGGGIDAHSFVTVTTVVPEPGAVALLAAGLSSLLCLRKKKGLTK